jgi:RNA polymerase sigma-70 factor (ECF subfamily)
MAVMTRKDEHELIRKAKAGEGSAIESLIRAHQDSLYAFMLRMSGKPETAEDVVQEAFVRVLKNLDRFDTRFRFSTWLFTIAKRLYVNIVQKQKPLYDSDAISIQMGKSATPGALSSRAETMDNARSLLEAALDGLSEQQREIVLLFHQQSWAITEIALHLDMPEGTVKSHLHRARQRMKKFIESDPITSERVSEVWA